MPKLLTQAHWPDFAHPVWRWMLLALSATIILSLVILQSTFPSGPDIPFHIYNAQRFANELRQGVLYPRWLGDWFGGYGAPIGLVYSPLSYFTVAGFVILGIPTLSAWKIVLWFSLFASGLFTFAFASRFMNGTGAMTAAILYQIAPYRLIDLYSRTALPEYVSFVWLPAILFLAYLTVSKGRTTHLVALAVSIAALIFTHVLIAYLFAIVCVPMTGYFILNHAQDRLKAALRIVSAGILGVLLAAIFWLPALWESQYMNTASFQGPAAWGNYLNNFLFGAQGYLGTEFERLYYENEQMGIAAVLSILVTGLAIIAILRLWSQHSKIERGFFGAMVILAVFTSFMSFGISRSVWALLPKSNMILFPWRWQTICALAVAVVGGNVVAWLRQSWTSTRFRIRWTAALQIPLFLALAGLVFYSGLTVWRHRNSNLDDQTVAQFLGTVPLQTSFYTWIYSGEYLPAWLGDFDYVAHAASQENPVKAQPPAEIKTVQWTSQRRVLSVNAAENTTVNVRTFWFPGWGATVNGNPVKIDVDPEDGTMHFAVPSGQSSVTLLFENTPDRTVSAILSALALVALLGLTILGIRQNVRLTRVAIVSGEAA